MAGAGGKRAIDVRLEELPAIDAHSIEIRTGPERAWEALIPVVRASFGGRGATRAAKLLGCEQTQTGGDPTHPGATISGFVVARAIRPVLYALLGAHRFSRYALVFRIDTLPNGNSLLSAETRAEFPGATGRVYRALVIGTRGHVLVVRRLLAAVKRRAERSDDQGPSSRAAEAGSGADAGSGAEPGSDASRERDPDATSTASTQ